MTRFRLFLLGLLAVLAVLAVGAVASGSASAASCTAGSMPVFCTSPGNLPIVHESVLGLGGLSVLAGQIGGVEIKFHCPDVHVTGTLKLLGEFPGVLLFLHCVQEKPASCKLSMNNELNGIDAKFTAKQESATLALYTGSGSSEEFTSMEVEDVPGQTCAVTGKLPVTGRQMVETPTGGTGSVKQEVVAKKSESFLIFFGQPVTFSGTAKVHLASSEKWLVMSGD